MKKWMITLISLAFSFMFVLTGIGYAQVSTDLTLNALAVSPKYVGVYITDVSLYGSAPAGASYGSLDDYVLTMQSNTLTLPAGREITFAITVESNADFAYYFDGMGYFENSQNSESIIYTNKNITFTVIDPDTGKEYKQGTMIEGGATKTFRVTFKNNVQSTQTLEYKLNYPYVLTDNSTAEAATKHAVGRFVEILNTPALYSNLTTAMNRTSGQRISRSYMGNVAGDDASNDSAKLLELFTYEDPTTNETVNSLVLTINEKEYPVTAMIKRENLDGSYSTGATYSNGLWNVRGNEFTLYMTAVDFDAKSQNGLPLYGIDDDIPVYAVVFTSDDGGATWYQVTDIVAGMATINDYYGTGGNNPNSFNTDTWRVSKEGVKMDSRLQEGKNIEWVIANAPYIPPTDEE